MSLQLSDNNWILRIDTEFESNIIKHSLGTFTSPFIAIEINSNLANSLWNQAGRIVQAINIGTELGYGMRQDVVLRQLSFFEFPLLSGTNYELYYFPLLRLGTVTLKVWEYAGVTQDKLINELVIALQNQILTVNLSTQNLDLLNTIDQKINNLMGIFSEQINGANATDIITWTVAVTTTPSSLAPANAARKGMTIKNTGNRPAYIGFTSAVSSNNNFVTINANASYEFHPNYTGEIFVVGLASTNLFVTQFI